MKTLITGASGFIGSRLAKRLKENGWEVKGLFLPNERQAIEEAEKSGIEIAVGDITQPKTLTNIMDGIDVVFHLAGIVTVWGKYDLYKRVVVDGTRNLLFKSVGKVSRFIFFSSVCALGLGRHLDGLNEDSEKIYDGIPYSMTKVFVEEMLVQFYREYNISYTVLRPNIVIGPGSGWVTGVIDSFVHGNLPLIDKGVSSNCFIHVENLIDGSIQAAQSEKAKNRIYHFRDDYNLSWAEYLQFIGSLVKKAPKGNLSFNFAWGLGRFLETVYSPFNTQPPLTRMVAGLMGRKIDFDNTRAKKELKWSTRVSLEEAMHTIEQWVGDCYLPMRGN